MPKSLSLCVRLFKILLNGIRKLTQTHPDPSTRIEELRRWCDPEFEAIQRGEYPRRGAVEMMAFPTGLQTDLIGLRTILLGVEGVLEHWNPF